MNRRSRQLSFDGITTYSAENRVNLVRIDSLKRPGQYEAPAWGNGDFDELVSRVKKARAGGHEVILSMGAHVIKCGLGPYLIALMREGFITHIAGNGACSIHDFELSYLGGTYPTRHGRAIAVVRVEQPGACVIRAKADADLAAELTL